jgi:hypothetical protein
MGISSQGTLCAVYGDESEVLGRWEGVEGYAGV